MAFSDPYERWRQDELDLAEIGKSIQNVGREIWIELPDGLADRAIEAWERDEAGEMAEVESAQQQKWRHQAGSLALIGAILSERGNRHDGRVSAAVDGWLIGHALDAADDHGLIRAGEPSPPKDRAPRFINVDLDLKANTAMPELAEHLERVGCLLHHGPSGEHHLLTFELSTEADGLNDTCRQIVEVIDALTEPLRRSFDNAASRTLNVGIESTNASPVVRISPEVVTAAARLAMEVEITHYPSPDDTTGPFAFRHYLIE